MTQAATTAATFPIVPTVIPNPVAGLDALGDAAGAARAWVADRHNWVRVGWVVAGVVLFGIGLNALASRATGGAVSAGGVTRGVQSTARRVL